MPWKDERLPCRPPPAALRLSACPESTNDCRRSGPQVEAVPVELFDRTAPDESHGPSHVARQEIEDAVHPGLTGRPQPVEVGPARHAGGGSERQRLDDVTPASDSTIADDLDSVPDR